MSVHASVKQKAVLASVNIRHWTGRRLDREVTAEINLRHNAVADAGRYNKLLLPAQAFGGVNYVVGTARGAYIDETLPWLLNARILPTMRYDGFAKRFRQLEQDFAVEKGKFIRDFPKNKAKRKVELNGMFREEDYPTEAELPGLFSFSVSIMPFPDKDDFRVDLAKEHIEDIKNEMEAKLQESINNAMLEPVRRIIEVVRHMNERLGAYKQDTYKTKKGVVRPTGKFTDSLVDNIRELCEVLPAFNLTNNKQLTDLTNRMVKELCAHDAQDLREDDRLRRTVKRSARDILAHAEMLMA